MVAQAAKKRILILGGGFAGVATARHLERQLRRRCDVEIVLASRDNFLLMTPLLFEVFSGALDVRACSFPIRAFLRSTPFVEAAVDEIDLDRRVVYLQAAEQTVVMSYDHLVVALGSLTNRDMIPGSQHAFTFKTLADALILRNHVIERFERADVEADPERKQQLLTFVIIGGGLVGVELLGELTAFVDGILPFYESVDRSEVHFELLQGSDRIMPEIDPELAEYGAQILAARLGVVIRTNTFVQAIEPGEVHLADEVIEADTIVLAAGTVPNPALANLPTAKNKRGQIEVEPTLRSRTHSNLWCLGDCASIPGPDGKLYPSLAQHALRAARTLARNISQALDDKPGQPFIYQNLGMMGSLGHFKGFGQLLKVKVRGFPAWFIRRTYYLFQMPGWSRRLRIVIDWTFALLFRPDVVKVGLDSETALLLHQVARRETRVDGRHLTPELSKR